MTGEAGSMQGARYGTRSQVSRIRPWAEGLRIFNMVTRQGALWANTLGFLGTEDDFNTVTAGTMTGMLYICTGSWRPGIESHVSLPVWSLLLPLPVSLPLCVCVSIS
ncbi:unnamed protein product [Nyctereutes procyonoides]|uniref:(raccoon dog) hypothetical protein n=1 Tax=Nyctereutes procyonoides TaxID=34880 RepID=A0A811XYA4_NYCPR|nr:unnamed protein product [Nyctereutes procyonoides]